MAPKATRSTPPASRFVAYFRVSTDRQGRSGLGIEAQQEAVARHIATTGGRVVAEFREIESGRKSDRPELAKALDACRKHHAALLVAKFDRLARDAHFLLGLEKAGVEFVAADMPHANRLTVGIMALVAEEEARAISARTKAALAAAKARGVKLGGRRQGSPDMAPHAARGGAASVEVRREAASRRAADLAPIVRELQAQGVTSLAGLALALTAQGVPTTRGSATWQAVQVGRLLRQMEGAG